MGTNAITSKSLLKRSEEADRYLLHRFDVDVGGFAHQHRRVSVVEDVGVGRSGRRGKVDRQIVEEVVEEQLANKFRSRPSMHVLARQTESVLGECNR
jgi:hypothetical protein